MRKLLGFCLVFLSLVPLACTSIPPIQHEPQILAQVVDLVKNADTKNGKTVVIFDLDDTVFDNRHRTLAILRDFAKLPTTQSEHPDVAKRLLAANLEQMHYDYQNSLREVGISDPKIVDAIKTWWTEKYFSNAYCLVDQPMAGSIAYVRSLYDLGAHIVYLTGRNEPNMKKGTLESMRKLGFPMGKRTTLILKPRFEMDDLIYKKGAFEQIRKLGQVIASFENEPRNLNAMGEAFPKSVLVFIDSQHSSAPDVPTEQAHWVKDFQVALP